MTTATLTHYQINAKKRNRAGLRAMSLPKINWRVLFVVGFTVMILSLFFYVYQIYNLTRGYYLVNNYENRLEQLLKENQNLEVNFAENSFLGEVLSDALLMNFQKATAVKYIQISDNSFALNAK